MAKKGKQQPREPEQTAADFYRLNVRAVEDLATADESNSPPVSREELRKYQGRRKLHLADWVKAVLLKCWFAGVVCYFFVWGLGAMIPNQLDLVVVTGIAMGVVIDLLENNLFRFYAQKPGDNDRWMMVTRKGFLSLPVNVLYGLLLVWCVSKTYDTINTAWIAMQGENAGILGVGPILFGIFTTAWDLLFLAIKRGLQRIAGEARQKAGQPKGESHD